MASKTILVDTNIFLEFLLDQKRSEECVRLMQMIENTEVEACVTSFTLHGIEVLLERTRKIDGLEKFLDWIINTKNLSVYHTSPQEELGIARMTQTTGIDFDDTLQYFVAKSLGAALVSFDRDFDKTDIERIEPRDL
jgi:hypothetical protein